MGALDRLDHFRLIPRFETYPAVVRFSESVPGRLVLLGLFAALLVVLQDPRWHELVVILAVLSFMPSRRRILVALATLYWTASHAVDRFHMSAFLEQISPTPQGGQVAMLVGIALVLAFCGVYLGAVNRFSWFSKRPLRNLLVAYFAVLFGYAFLPPSLAPSGPWYWGGWLLLALMGKYIWFLGYSLQGRRVKGITPFYLQIGHYIGFWQVPAEPMGKGAAYLNGVEAKDSRALAICQIKAIKLLAWTVLMTSLHALCAQILTGARHLLFPFDVPFRWNVTRFDIAVRRAGTAEGLSWFDSWESLVVHFFLLMLGYAIWGHTTIAVLRMAGFNALRNTCRPLRSGSMLEFWSRIMYYFKELLVTLFFYPTFFRCFKKSPRLRSFFAIFMAAGVGNYMFHLTEQHYGLAGGDPLEYLRGTLPMLVSFLALAVSVGVSQLRRQRGAHSDRGWFRDRIVAPAGVVFVFCLIAAFDNAQRNTTLTEHLYFFASLFGFSAL